jgi:UDP-N-acetylmuramyl pentapeptide phosphotransferase/UDP-N-acetylglucosamine-1-phosphate transferase
MGGLLIFGTVFLVTAPTNLFDKASIFLPLGIIVATGTLGLIDDFLTIEGRSPASKGINKRQVGLLIAPVWRRLSR